MSVHFHTKARFITPESNALQVAATLIDCKVAIMFKQSEDYKAFEKPKLAFEGKLQSIMHHVSNT
jgi:hypothetical protein